MHLGSAQIRGSHPLKAAGLIERHPATRFLLMHLAFPWSRELLGLAFVYRNIWLDLTWSALLSPTYFKQSLHEAIEVLPDESRLMIGGDNWHVEETYGAIHLSAPPDRRRASGEGGWWLLQSSRWPAFGPQDSPRQCRTILQIAEERVTMRRKLLVFVAILVIDGHLASAGRGGTGQAFVRAIPAGKRRPEGSHRPVSAGAELAQYDPELGYILGNYLPADGMDKSTTISTVQANGARTSFMYAGKPCRINTYGDSFTQCHQVSDGETWQEYLAGHLGEPIRNFGMGGYGVYQAYRRMVREERTDHGAEYIIFYIWGDDHIRSLLRCRHAIIFRWWNHQGGRAFHNNFWPNIEMDLQTGRFVEKDNLLPIARCTVSNDRPAAHGGLAQG